MLFIIIFFITLLLSIYIFKNLTNEKLTLLVSLTSKSKKIVFYFFGFFLFSTSSMIYYEIGSPFIDMNELYISKEKLIQKTIDQDKIKKEDLKKFEELVHKSNKNPNNINILFWSQHT